MLSALHLTLPPFDSHVICLTIERVFSKCPDSNSSSSTFHLFSLENAAGKEKWSQRTLAFDRVSLPMCRLGM